MNKKEFLKNLMKQFYRWWRGLPSRTRWIIVGVVAFVILIAVFSGGEDENLPQTPQNASQSIGTGQSKITTKKDVKKVKNQLEELYEEQQEALDDLRDYYEDYPLFTVMGSVEDRSEDSLQLWGTALQETLPGMKTHWAQRMKDANLIILEPDDNSGLPHYQGKHHFLKKETGKNRLGEKVPVLVFGPIKSSAQAKFDKAQNRYDSVNSQIAELERSVSRTAEVEITLENLDFEEAVKMTAEKVYTAVDEDITVTAVRVTLYVSASAVTAKQKNTSITYTKNQLIGTFTVDNNLGEITGIRSSKNLKNYLKDDANLEWYRGHIKHLRGYHYFRS